MALSCPLGSNTWTKRIWFKPNIKIRGAPIVNIEIDSLYWEPAIKYIIISE